MSVTRVRVFFSKVSVLRLMVGFLNVVVQGCHIPPSVVRPFEGEIDKPVLSSRRGAGELVNLTLHC